MPAHVRKGDTVYIRSGDYKGITGEVVRVIPKHNTVIVKGVNVQSKHVRPTQANPKGSIVEKELPIAMSKVSPVIDGKPVRVGFKVKADGSKIRVGRKAGKELKELSVIHGPRK